jgi:hypothetical protein
MKTLFQTYLEEFSDIQYCGHCLEANKKCCDENNYVMFKDLTVEQQKQIINQELDKYL